MSLPPKNNGLFNNKPNLHSLPHPIQVFSLIPLPWDRANYCIQHTTVLLFPVPTPRRLFLKLPMPPVTVPLLTPPLLIYFPSSNNGTFALATQLNLSPLSVPIIISLQHPDVTTTDYSHISSKIANLFHWNLRCLFRNYEEHLIIYGRSSAFRSRSLEFVFF